MKQSFLIHHSKCINKHAIKEEINLKKKLMSYAASY